MSGYEQVGDMSNRGPENPQERRKSNGLKCWWCKELLVDDSTGDQVKAWEWKVWAPLFRSPNGWCNGAVCLDCLRGKGEVPPFCIDPEHNPETISVFIGDRHPGHALYGVPLCNACARSWLEAKVEELQEVCDEGID